jgi:hypothetical protein
MIPTQLSLAKVFHRINPIQNLARAGTRKAEDSGRVNVNSDPSLVVHPTNDLKGKIAVEGLLLSKRSQRPSKKPSVWLKATGTSTVVQQALSNLLLI